MDRPTFSFRHGIPEGGGFKVGQRVSMQVETKGDDHEGIEQTMPVGTDGLIECIELLLPPQGLTFTIWIPVNELEGRGIVNVFDESDGHISKFISSKEKP